MVHFLFVLKWLELITMSVFFSFHSFISLLWGLILSNFLFVACFIMRLSNCYAISRTLNDAIKWVRWIHACWWYNQTHEGRIWCEFYKQLFYACHNQTHSHVHTFYLYSCGYTIDTFRCSIKIWCCNEFINALSQIWFRHQHITIKITMIRFFFHRCTKQEWKAVI